MTGQKSDKRQTTAFWKWLHFKALRLYYRTIELLRFCADALLLLFCATVPLSCGPGWEGYENNYSKPSAPNLGPWEGDEFVYVALGEDQIKVDLAGMQTHDYNGAPAVLLSDVIIQSSITTEPEKYRYDFTATDGYDLLIKRYNDVSLLPSWEEMKNGFLYRDSRYDDLTCGWTKHPWGSAESAYNVKYMNGGTITLIEYQ